MSHPLRVGIKLSQQHTDVETLRAVWHIGDEGGFDHIWVFDHFAPIGTQLEGPMLEGWTLLGAMAEATRRARIGCMVTGNTYRHPAVLAKMAVTVDQLSGGRLEMGIGAGWAEREHTMYGLPFPSTGERIDRLGEACALMKALWTQDVVEYSGRFYQLSGAQTDPKPVQRPHPPLWIGGQGERKTLRVVADHADVWNFPGDALDEATRLSAVLDQYCAEAGRDPTRIRRSVQLRVEDRGTDGVLRLAEGFVHRGFTELILIVAGPRAGQLAELAASHLLPDIRQLAAASAAR